MLIELKVHNLIARLQTRNYINHIVQFCLNRPRDYAVIVKQNHFLNKEAHRAPTIRTP